LPIPSPRRFPRAWLLAALALGAALAAPVTVLAGGSVSATPAVPEAAEDQPIPVPREQRPGDTAGFRLPFALGTNVTVEQAWNTTFSHNGKAAYAYDFAVPLGTPVVAAADGVVSYVHDGEVGCGGAALLMKANLVVIDHADGSSTQYGHLSTISVKVGDVVAAGQEIAKSGDTGYSQCLPHLHFARQYQGGVVTQSVPVYFEGYADQELHDGEVVTAEGPACAAPTPDAAVTGNLPVGSFCGAYYRGALNGSATFTRHEAVLDFDWATHGPGGYWLDDAKLGFSARWSGRFVFASVGTYAIDVVASGAVVVSIDGVPLLNQSVDGGRPIETVATRNLGVGIHQVDVQYQSTAGHGVLKVGWSLPPRDTRTFGASSVDDG
jgi:murein DD-endopeptidase MepM/ murein hydrolase activator NlpD